MSAGAAALWLAHHGSADPVVLTALNDLRALSYFVALVAVRAVPRHGRHGRPADRTPARLGGLVGARDRDRDRGQPAARAAADVIDVFGLLGLLWVVAVAVDLLRNPAVPRSAPVE